MSYTIIHRLVDRDSKYNLNVIESVETLQELSRGVLRVYPPKSAFEESHLLRFISEYVVFPSTYTQFIQSLVEEQRDWIAEVVPDEVFHDWADLVTIGMDELAIKGRDFLIGSNPSGEIYL